MRVNYSRRADRLKGIVRATDQYYHEMRVASTWKTRSSGLRKAVLPGKEGVICPKKFLRREAPTPWQDEAREKTGKRAQPKQ